jgi:hypothetical protein
MEEIHLGIRVGWLMLNFVLGLVLLVAEMGLLPNCELSFTLHYSFCAVLTRNDSELDAPAVPATLPYQLGALSGLQSLKVIGNNQIPGKTSSSCYNYFF